MIHSAISIFHPSSVQQTADLFQQPESKQNNDKHREPVQASPAAAAGGTGRTGSGHIPEDLIPNEMLPGTRMAVAIEIEHTHESSPSKIVGRSVLLPHLYHTIRRSDNTGSVLQHSTCYFAACGKPVNFHLPEVTSCSRHPHYPKSNAVKMQHLPKAAKKTVAARPKMVRKEPSPTVQWNCSCAGRRMGRLNSYLCCINDICE